MIHPKNADRMANNADPDQTAPLGIVRSGSALFAMTCPICSEPDLQIRGGIEDNSKIVFLICQLNHML